MPSSAFRPFWLAIGSLLLCGGVLLLGSCDGAGSKRASFYQRLLNEGPWTIQRLEGPLIDPTRLDDRYVEIRVTFRGGDEGRRYRIAGQLAPDSTRILAAGAVALPGDDVLQMASGFDRFVTWTYNFQASRAAFTLESGSRSFLRALFPGTTWSESQELEMTLVPDDE